MSTPDNRFCSGPVLWKDGLPYFIGGEVGNLVIGDGRNKMAVRGLFRSVGLQATLLEASRHRLFANMSSTITGDLVNGVLNTPNTPMAVMAVRGLLSVAKALRPPRRPAGLGPRGTGNPVTCAVP